MGRPAELADRLAPIRAGSRRRSAVFASRAKVRGIARDIGDARHRRRGELRHLLLRAGAGRIEHHRLEAVELLRVERPAEEVAMVDEDGRWARLRRRLQRQRRVARAFGGIDLARRAPARRCRGRRTDRRRCRASPTASRTAATSAASPSAVACRKAPCGSGTGTPPSVIVTGSGSQRGLRRRSRRRARAGRGRGASAKAVSASAASSPSALTPLEQQVDALVGEREPDPAAPARLQQLGQQSAQRRDQREQFGPQDMAFAHVDDAVAGLGVEAEQHLLAAPLGPQRGAAAALRRREMRRAGCRARRCPARPAPRRCGRRGSRR